MRYARTVGALMALVLALSVAAEGQKGGKPPSDQPSTLPIPLKVTFLAFDSGTATALRGHPGTGDVIYEDRTGGVDAYVTREGNLWFHIDCRSGNHIDLGFRESNHVLTGDDEPVPYAEGDMQTFRITTWAPSTATNHFGDMKAGEVYTNHPICIQYWTDVDQYAWNLQYDGLPHLTNCAQNGVNIAVSGDATQRTWTITPTTSPQHLGFAETLFEKYFHRKPQPGGFLDYGTWTMPFKIEFEQLR